MSILNTGAPHFKSVMKQHRHANYTLPKVINEFIDNIVKKTDEIRIFTQVDDTQKLQEVKVSDNYIHGFDSLDCDGVNNPFNMGHIKLSHDDDTETSEFGVGMKAGALSAANQLNVYTRIKNSDGTFKFIEVICDFIRMSNETDVNASYNPRIKLISYEEYREQHPFEFGSTLKLSKIRDCIYSKTTHNEITQDISNCVSDTYVRFLSRGTKLFVNDVPVMPNYDFFEDPKCEPFTISKELFILEKAGITTYIIRKTKEISVWQEFNRSKSEWTKLKEHNDGLLYIQDLIKSGYKHIYSPFTDEGVCMNINTIFTFYSDMYHTLNPGSEPEIPEDSVYIYKDDRNYGKQSLLKHNNGVHNYTLHEIDFVSKRLGKELGITFNKEILMNGNNDLIIAIKAALMDSRSDFTADTHSNKNAALCERAIKKELINLMTCSEAKLSMTHRTTRTQFEKPLPSIVTIKSPKSKKIKVPKPEDDVNDDLSELSDSENIFNLDTKYKVVKEILVEEVEEEEEEVEEVVEEVVKEVINAVITEVKEVIKEGVKEVIKEEVIVEEVIVEEVIVEEVIKEEVNAIDTDLNERRKRTIIIMDYLRKSITESNEFVLSDEVLNVFENIFI